MSFGSNIEGSPAETKMVYLAFIFALALACLAGMEFIFLMTLETRNRQLKRRVDELEKESARVREMLRSSAPALEQQGEEEIWPELIDDNPHL
jgi:hypothetical protein